MWERSITSKGDYTIYR